jgi:hypothetical protein
MLPDLGCRGYRRSREVLWSAAGGGRVIIIDRRPAMARAWYTIGQSVNDENVIIITWLGVEVHISHAFVTSVRFKSEGQEETDARIHEAPGCIGYVANFKRANCRVTKVKWDKK